MMDKNESPLISIIVITYNLSKYVLETLESAYNQTYQNIELIVSDDYSTDNTIEICAKWIEQNKSRFVRVELVTVNKNTGVSANCNRGVHAAKGEWIKLIAGDDTLLNTCIEDNLDFVKNYGEPVNIAHSNMNIFSGFIRESSFQSVFDSSGDLFNYPQITASDQFQLLLRTVIVRAPTLFIKRDFLVGIGGYDQEMPYEDWPLYLKITKNNIKIHYFPKITVNYRRHNESMFNLGLKGELLFNNFFSIDKKVYECYRRSHLQLWERFFEWLEYNRKNLFLNLRLNKSSRINRWINLPFDFIYHHYKQLSLYFVRRKIRKFRKF